MTAPSTLFDIAGLRARIFTLPGRPPFMLAADLAEVYGTVPKRITEQVKRNPARFPDRYAFRLTEDEEVKMIAQNALSFGKKRADLRPLAFTHGGANMLSGVLKSPVADEMAVAINDAFTEMEQQAIREARFMLQKLRIDVYKKPIYIWCVEAARQGWDFEHLFRSTNYTRKKLEMAVRELVAMRIIPSPLKGMQADLFAED